MECNKNVVNLVKLLFTDKLEIFQAVELGGYN